MIPVSSLQLRQQYAAIGIESERGSYQIRQSQARMKIHTALPRLEIEAQDGVLQFDQSRAWDALAVGSVMRLNERIYSQSKDIVMRGIARIVENGNRMAAIHLGGSSIADIAEEQAFADLEIEYPGPASTDNVKISYTANQPVMNGTPGAVTIEAQVRPPEIQYHRGDLQIYLRQKNSLEVLPPALDFTI